MAESFSVKAILSAADKGFTSTMEKADSKLSSLGSKIKSGLGFGILTGIGQQAFSSITSGISGVISELGASSAAWKTFNGNMGMLGKSSDEIISTKKELQKFATQTIYSASDMATTYSQLAAVGTKNCTQLVKGFGGLAAAAENPTQAMKTLSTQATQMAAKPKVAWQDFKLMLEQTPAGVAAVAKEMGMSTSKLVSKVQDGTVKTEDFFNAIAKVGTNDAFTKLATEYKTVDQAMDGLTETLGVKLAPAFDYVSKIGIDAISGLVDKLDGFNADSLVNTISGAITTIQPYWDAFSKAAGKVAGALFDVGGVIVDVGASIATNETVIKTFSDVMSSAGDMIAFVGNIIADNSDIIVAATPWVAGFFLAWKGYKKISSAVTALQKFGDKLMGITQTASSGLTEKLDGIAGSQTKVGKSSKKSAKNMLASAKSFMMMGAGILMVSAGFALLAYSAIQLANAGPLAIGVMAGLVVALAAMGAGMTLMLNSIKPGAAKLNAISLAMLAMGTALVLVSAGFAILTASAINLANAGPLAIGVMVGMIATIALLAAGAAILGPALTAGAVGFIAFGAAIVLVGVGALLAATALTLVAGVLPTVCEYGLLGAGNIALLGASMIAFGAGAVVAGAGALILAAGLIAVGVGALGAAVGVLALAVASVALGAGINLCALGAVILGPALLTLSAGALAAGASLLVLTAGVLAFTASGVASLAGTISLTAGFVAFGASLLVVTAGMIALAAGLLGVLGSMKSIASSAKTTEKSLKAMKSSISFVNSALEGLGSLAKSAIKSLISSFSNAEGKAKTAGQNIGNNISSGVQTGATKMVLIASLTTMQTIGVFQNGQAGAYGAGVYIGQGLGNGMSSQLGYVRSVASQLASAAEKAIRAKAQIHSPSRVSTKLGNFWGKGLGNGIVEMKNFVKKAADKLFSIPVLNNPKIAFAGDFDSNLSEDYEYYQNTKYTINVPVIMDGKEVARVTAPFTQEEIEKNEKLKNMIKGMK